MTHVASPLVIGFDGRFLQDKFHGVGRYAYGLLDGLCMLGGDHRMVVFVDPMLPNTRFPLERLVQSGKLELCPVSLPLYSARELWAWPANLRGLHVDLFHTPYFWSPLTLPCPLVTTVHDMIWDHYPQYTPGLRFLAPYKVASRLMIRRARLIIADSDATKDDISRFTSAPDEKIVTVPLGVDHAFRPIYDEDERRAVRTRYGLPSSYILSIGARRPHKNLGRLISAFGQIAGETALSLVLVGATDGNFSDEVSRALSHLQGQGKIHEITHVEEKDLAALYSMADLYVQPSIIEGFGLPVLEAMACGCPVICSDTSSLPEVASDAAVFFNPQSVTAIADTLRRILASPELRCDLRRRGLEHARGYSWERAARQTLAVYHGVAAMSRHRGRVAGIGISCPGED